MNKIKLFLASLGVVTFGVFAFVAVPTVGAIDPLGGEVCKNNNSMICDKKGDKLTDSLNNIINTLLFVVGALSVLMIIVSGIMYTTSTGDAQRVAKAKNTLMYSIVGLVVAFLAYAIVNWVLTIF